MTEFFKIEMLPARHGDSIWIEYGDRQKPHRILIDGGPEETYDYLKHRIEELPKDERNFELLIVTHVDADHIEGILKLLNDRKIGITIKDIWFNGWRHLPGSGFEEFGPVQGEKLTTILDRNSDIWNKAFKHRSVTVPNKDKPPKKKIEGGIELTVLSPFRKQLAQLRPVWVEECRKAGLDPRYKIPVPKKEIPGFEALGPLRVEELANKPYKKDLSKANGSSIAILAEYQGRKVLLAGDARAETILKSIKKINRETGNERLDLEAFKLAHHGSKHNLNKEILDAINCNKFLISTNGDKFKHPDRESVARIIKFGSERKILIFNYKTNYNSVWNNRSLMKRYDYEVVLPSEPNSGELILFSFEND